MGQALWPFIKQIFGSKRVTLEGQHQAKLFAEPLQRLIPVGGDRSRYDIMSVNLVETVAHQTNRIPFSGGVKR